MTLILAFAAFTGATILDSGAAAILRVWTGRDNSGRGPDDTTGYDIRTW